MKNIYFLLLVCCLTYSCNRNSDDSGLGFGNQLENLDFLEDGWLTFGWFYGECLGETCVEIYRMNQNVMREDTLDLYPSGNMLYQGEFIQATMDAGNGFTSPVSTAGFLVLMEEFPETLLDETEVLIGQPDAGDWGGIYLEYTLGEVKKYWLIDQMKVNVPDYLHDYIDLVNTKIAILSQN